MKTRRVSLLCRLLLLVIGIGSASAASADVLVSAFYYGSVLRYDERTGAYLGTFVAPHSGGLQNPSGIDFGPDGDLYIADSGTGQILRYDGATGAYKQVIATVNAATDIEFDHDGYLYVPSFASPSFYSDGIAVIDITTGTRRTLVPRGSGGMYKPFRVAFGPDGNLYVADIDRGILRFNRQTGAFIDVFVPRDLSRQGYFGCLYFGLDGVLYVSVGLDWFYSGNPEYNQILRFDAVTGAPLGVLAQGYPLSSPDSLQLGPDGALYVANNNAYGGAFQGILRYDPRTGAYLGPFATDGLSSGFAGLYTIIFTPRQPGQLTISNVRASQISSTSATIAWSTNMPADSEVTYWYFDGSWCRNTVRADARVTGHSVRLDGLTPGKLYTYQVRSTDVVGGNTVTSAGYTFVTALTYSGGDPLFRFTIKRIPDNSYQVEVVWDYPYSPFSIYYTNVELTGGYLGSAPAPRLSLGPWSSGTKKEFSMLFPSSAGKPGTRVRLHLEFKLTRATFGGPEYPTRDFRVPLP